MREVPEKIPSVEKQESASITKTSAPAFQQVSLEVQLADGTQINAAPDPISNSAMSLNRAIELGLSSNPDLIALRQNENVGSAAVGVAYTYPFNPFIQAQATPAQFGVGEGQGSTYHYVLMMQRFQLARQQRHREDAATSSLNGIRWTIHQAELQNVMLTMQTYFTALYQKGLVDIARASHQNNKRLLQVSQKRFEAGAAAAADVATIRVDTKSTERQLQLAEANYQTSLRDLWRQLGLPTDSPFDVEGDLQSFSWDDPASQKDPKSAVDMTMTIDENGDTSHEWITSWAYSRPDVMAAHANIDVARANLRLASADRVPDLQAGPYYQHNPSGLSLYGFRVEMNLPVINSGKPLETQRAAELGQQSTVWHQLRRRAELEAEAAYERYELIYRALLGEGADPSSDLPSELQSLEQQFAIGEVDVVRVIQARTSLLQNQRARLDQFNELSQAAAALIGATGMPVEMLFGESLLSSQDRR